MRVCAVQYPNTHFIDKIFRYLSSLLSSLFVQSIVQSIVQQAKHNKIPRLNIVDTFNHVNSRAEIKPLTLLEKILDYYRR